MERSRAGLAAPIPAMTHDPVQFASSLGNKLAAQSRHVCAFLGAGVGKACGLPDMEELQQGVLNDSSLPESDRACLNRQLDGRNLEQALSRLRGIATLLSEDETLGDITAETAKNLDMQICKIISRELATDRQDLTAVQHLAAWAHRAHHHLPVELFTVNYDLLMETALEDTRVPYFDGFIGTLKASFDTELVENLPGSNEEAIPAFFVRLWKLHGSVNWQWSKDRKKIIRLGQPAEDHAAAIYPSDTKYEESRRVPFVVLQDRLRRSLHQPETVLLITGYSFRDEHLNEHIFSAAMRRPRSEFIAFCKDGIPDNLAEKSSDTRNLQALSPQEAILGGERADWAVPEDRDKDAPENIWKDGEFTLCDFKNLARYLALSAAHDFHGDNASLRKLLEEIVEQEAAQDLQSHA